MQVDACRYAALEEVEGDAVGMEVCKMEVGQLVVGSLLGHLEHFCSRDLCYYCIAELVEPEPRLEVWRSATLGSWEPMIPCVCMSVDDSVAADDHV